MFRENFLPRGLLVYGLCLPLAVLLGYLLATPFAFRSFTIVALVLCVLAIPLLLRWHFVILFASWNAAKSSGERPMPALFNAMDRVLEQQAARLAIPRRFEATIKEIWSLQPRFEQRAGQRPFRLLEHPRFRAGYDFLRLRCDSGEFKGKGAGLADWWERFQHAGQTEREQMLHPDEAPKKRRRSRGRGRKRSGGDGGTTSEAAPAAGDS